MIALSLLHNHHYSIESKDNTTLLCPSPLNTIKTLPKRHTKGEDAVSSLTYSLSLSPSLSLSLRVSIHSQSLIWAFEGVSGQPVQTFLCREAESPDSSTETRTFTATSRGRIHPQLTQYQHLC